MSYKKFNQSSCEGFVKLRNIFNSLSLDLQLYIKLKQHIIFIAVISYFTQSMFKGAFHRWRHEYVLKLGPICSRIIK